ncbi:MAG: NUDIX domain-containing protein [Candidatus Woesearchaeota archaeon]
MDKEEYDKKKGADFTGVSVVFICHDGNGNILMNKRSKKCRDEHGNWDIGGGSVEFGHKIEDTLRREIKEEYCTDIIGYEFLGFRDIHREVNGKPTHWIALDFKVHVDRSKAKIGEPEKADAIGWFTLDKLPTPCHSQLPKFLELYKDKL